MSWQWVGLAIVLCVWTSPGAVASDSCCQKSSSAFTSPASKSESVKGTEAVTASTGKKRVLGMDRQSDSVRIQRPVEEQFVFYLESSPFDEFNKWLRTKINPSLCQMVLCQRGCESTEMPCSPLGVSAIRQYLYDRSSEGCCDAYEGADKSK